MNDQSACDAGEPTRTDTTPAGPAEASPSSAAPDAAPTAPQEVQAEAQAEAPQTELPGRVASAAAEAPLPEPPTIADLATGEVAGINLAAGEIAAIDLASGELAAIEPIPPGMTVDQAPSIPQQEIEPEAEPEALPLFSELGLSEPILRAIEEKGYRHPTPIQAQAIPAVLSGRDVMGVAQTGTGKTAGFTLPMLDILSGSRARARMPRSLILEPTRELALQVAENFVAYGKYLKLTHALLIGGESVNDQKEALMKGVDVLIATPGRLIDLFERGGMMLTDAKLLVIDEADRMLDMGFIPDVERIVAMLPKTRQTLFFSATMAPEIRRLSDAFLQNPRLITVSRSASVATTIVTGLALVAEHDKREALRRLIRSQDVQNALIFCNRKRDVDILFKSLTTHGFSVGALHGDMSQPARFATLERFKRNELRLLVCSDVAARGIDIGGLSHVFNFDVPHHAEDYVHRIGRTGRAGLKGHAFTLASPEDRLAVEAIEKLTGAPIQPFVVEGLDVVEWAQDDGRRGRSRGRGGKPAAKSSSSRSPSKSRSSETEDTPALIAAPAETTPAGDEAPAAKSEAKSGRSRSRRGGKSDKRHEDKPKPETTAEAALAPISSAPVSEAREPSGRDQPQSRDRGDQPQSRDRGSDQPRTRDRGSDQPQSRDRGRDRGQGAPREDRTDSNRRGTNRDSDASRPSHDYARDRPREYRRREEDLGPAVLAFGEETPAFMLLPTRRGRADFVPIDFSNATHTGEEIEPETAPEPTLEAQAESPTLTFVEAPEAPDAPEASAEPEPIEDVPAEPDPADPTDQQT